MAGPTKAELQWRLTHAQSVVAKLLVMQLGSKLTWPQARAEARRLLEPVSSPTLPWEKARAARKGAPGKSPHLRGATPETPATPRERSERNG